MYDTTPERLGGLPVILRYPGTILPDGSLEPMRWVLKNGILVTPTGLTGDDLLVEDGTIQVIGPDLEPGDGDGVVDLGGNCVLPGLVDMHTHLHLRVNGHDVADDFDTGTAAALAGGTTTVVEYVTPDPGESFRSALDRWRSLARFSRADFAFHLCVPQVTDAALAELPGLIREGVTGFKVFLAYPGRLMLAPGEIERVMSVVGPAGGVVFVHAEDGLEVERLRAGAVAAGRRSPIEHARSRPPGTELEAVRTVVGLVERTNCPTVVVHVSCGESARLIHEARGRGVPVFAETCPHYLWLTERHLLRPFPEAAHYICSPPLRPAADAARLWEGLAGGALQFIATDHAPFGSVDRLAAESFDRVPNGLSGIGTRLALTFAGGPCAGRFGLERLVQLLSTQPAMICGLYPRKGVLAPGADADLVMFDPDGSTDLGEEPAAGASDFNPWEGLKTRGRVLAVMGRGEWLYREGDLGPAPWGGAAPGRGLFLPRQPLDPTLLNQLQRKDASWTFSP
jgi:dihydropyrimidinase